MFLPVPSILNQYHQNNLLSQRVSKMYIKTFPHKLLMEARQPYGQTLRVTLLNWVVTNNSLPAGALGLTTNRNSAAFEEGRIKGLVCFTAPTTRVYSVSVFFLGPLANLTEEH